MGQKTRGRQANARDGDVNARSFVREMRGAVRDDIQSGGSVLMRTVTDSQGAAKAGDSFSRTAEERRAWVF